MESITELRTRLHRLERSQRRLHRILAAVLVVGAGLSLMAAFAEDEVPPIIRTQALEISDGKTGVVGLGRDKAGNGFLYVNNAAGKPVGGINVGEYGAYSWVSNPAGTKIAQMGAQSHGGNLRIWNNYGEVLAQIAVTDKGGALMISDRKGKPLCTLRVDDNGKGEVGAWDTKGQGQTLTPDS